MLRSLSKPRRRRHQERHPTRCLMSKPLMRDKALYIFFVVLCTQKYQSTKNTKYCVVWGKRTKTAMFSYLHLELSAVIAFFEPWHTFRATWRTDLEFLLIRISSSLLKLPAFEFTQEWTLHKAIHHTVNMDPYGVVHRYKRFLRSKLRRWSRRTIQWVKRNFSFFTLSHIQAYIWPTATI